jgi:hypothetical protein
VRILSRVVLTVVALNLAAACTYLPILPSRSNAPQEIKPPVPKLP